MSDGLHMWTIYWSPTDHPKQHVVVECVVMPGGQVLKREHPSAVVDTLAQARAVVPAGLVMMPRHPEDDPTIVETWL